MALVGELKSLQDSYGDGLDSQSHGESYFALFQSRFVPNGLYLLDEPEAPLSPMRQLTFISLLSMALRQDAQFIIATHSPIILAYPGADIISFDHDQLTQVDYESLEHVQVMRSFLDNPDAYLRHLIEE
jgi:predicted ATPase